MANKHAASGVALYGNSWQLIASSRQPKLAKRKPAKSENIAM
jgi:hypothetical protein